MALQRWVFGRNETMTLFSLEVEDESFKKVIKTLNPKGVFIGFPNLG